MQSDQKYSYANLAKLSTICDDGQQQNSVTGIDIQESQDGDSDNNIT